MDKSNNFFAFRWALIVIISLILGLVATLFAYKRQTKNINQIEARFTSTVLNKNQENQLIGLDLNAYNQSLFIILNQQVDSINEYPLNWSQEGLSYLITARWQSADPLEKTVLMTMAEKINQEITNTSENLISQSFDSQLEPRIHLINVKQNLNQASTLNSPYLVGLLGLIVGALLGLVLLGDNRKGDKLT